MDEKKLTREEIALSIFSGIVASVDDGSGNGAYMWFQFPKLHEARRRGVCNLAFSLADDFIQERDRQK